jgi:hypothetical protein
MAGWAGATVECRLLSMTTIFAGMSGAYLSERPDAHQLNRRMNFCKKRPYLEMVKTLPIWF